MEVFFQTVLNDPFIGKIVAIAVGIVIINLIIRFLHRQASSRLQPKEMRYGFRRGLTIFGYLAALILVIAIFSNQLSSITVALSVAGAGIAFALQEVIVSIAGWVALSFGQFYTVGDRIQLGGIKGDVIDIGVLRTTIMEIGEWVKGDQYSRGFWKTAGYERRAIHAHFGRDCPNRWESLYGFSNFSFGRGANTRDQTPKRMTFFVHHTSAPNAVNP